MKKILLLALAASIPMAMPAVAQSLPRVPSVGAPEPSPTALPRAPSVPSNADIGALGSAADSLNNSDTWGSLDDTTRYLLIMGSADGFTAAGASAPCFPGQDNTSIDKKLTEAGFGAQKEVDLPGALRKLSADPSKCAQAVKRGYTTGLLKAMPDTHLATYLSGLVRAYASIKTCPVPAQQYAAATVIAAIFASPDSVQPNVVIAPAIVEGCKGPPK